MAKSRVKRGLSIALICVGFAVFVYGVHLETRNPRSDADDHVAWFVLGVGVAMIAVGASVPFVPLWLVVVIGIVSPFLAFGIAVIMLWSFIILSACFRFV